MALLRNHHAVVARVLWNNRGKEAEESSPAKLCVQLDKVDERGWTDVHYCCRLSGSKLLLLQFLVTVFVFIVIYCMFLYVAVVVSCRLSCLRCLRCCRCCCGILKDTGMQGAILCSLHAFILWHERFGLLQQHCVQPSPSSHMSRKLAFAIIGVGGGKARIHRCRMRETFTVTIRYVTAGISNIFLEIAILIRLRYGAVSFSLIRKRL